MKVRTRFAPSPTGYIHVGNARTALLSWLVAKQNSGGAFIIRIEDTDQQRFVEGAAELIFETLKWLSLDWNEGPNIGGNFGPYIQTKRKDIYLEWANKLIEKASAYADPYTPQEVEEFRMAAKVKKIPFLYRDHRPKNPPKWDGSQPLRFKVKNLKRYDWDDPIMGKLSAGPEALDDFIIIKSDGLPTYNFAHIIDDIEMQITHVIRGLEFISSTPKYLSLYDALGVKPPNLACMSHIMAPDGKKKLGKRDGAKSVVDYRDQGILPEAMMNFLATLGWNDGTKQEIFTKNELIKKFDLRRVQRAGAIFDEKRLYWMNGHWIRSLKLDDLYKRSKNYWPKNAETYEDSYKKQVLGLVQERLKYLAELPELTEFFFLEPKPDLDFIKNNKQLSKFSKKELHQMLQTAADSLKKSNFSKNNLTDTLNGLLKITGQKPVVLFSLIRIATTWAPASPDLAGSLNVLEQKRSLERIQKALDLLC